MLRERLYDFLFFVYCLFLFLCSFPYCSGRSRRCCSFPLLNHDDVGSYSSFVWMAVIVSGRKHNHPNSLQAPIFHPEHPVVTFAYPTVMHRHHARAHAT